MPGNSTDLHQEIFSQGASRTIHRMLAGSHGRAHCQRICVVKFHLGRKGKDDFDKQLQPISSLALT